MSSIFFLLLLWLAFLILGTGEEFLLNFDALFVMVKAKVNEG